MSDILLIFSIALLGYILGSVKIAGLKLGSSAVLLAALVFGHFGFSVNSVIRNFGLACFVCAVGLIAGPVFFRNFQKNALSYIGLGILTIAAGAAATIAALRMFSIPTPLAVGMFSGALTSTPGLAAAMEATENPLASVGYGIAYPFGVVGVVLFVQLIPKLEKRPAALPTASMADERTDETAVSPSPEKKRRPLESSGMLTLSAAMVAGLALSAVTVPLPGGASFSLGISGGPLLTGLLLGHFNNLGSFSLAIPVKTLETLRELGLMLFLAGAGTGAGQGFVEVLAEYGVGLFLIGAMITLVPMLVSYWFAKRFLKLSLFDNLGAICGGMTSTPALGTLISVAQTDSVAAAYAATYPIALICVVLCCQFIPLLF